MSKRIVLKSVLAVVMVGFVLCVSSCEKDNPPKKEDPKKEEPKEHAIVGKWKYEKIELKELVCSNPLMEDIVRGVLQQPDIINAFAADFTGDFEFTKDGSVIRKTTAGNDTGSYTINNNKLTMTSSSISGTFDFSITNGTMYLDINAFDFAGEYAAQLAGMGITKIILTITFTKQ